MTQLINYPHALFILDSLFLFTKPWIWKGAITARRTWFILFCTLFHDEWCSFHSPSGDAILLPLTTHDLLDSHKDPRNEPRTSILPWLLSSIHPSSFVFWGSLVTNVPRSFNFSGRCLTMVLPSPVQKECVRRSMVDKFHESATD